MAEDIKPRTIPDALGLTERKYVAIYNTVEESLKEQSTIDALVSLRELFVEKDELIAAIYMYSAKVGAAKAEAKLQDKLAESEQNTAKAFVVGQMIAIAQFEELERRGVIKIVDKEGLRRGIPNPAQNSTGVPDELLYGDSSVRTAAAEPAKKEQPKKKDDQKKDEQPDAMYG
jgi:hypothetical protein